MSSSPEIICGADHRATAALAKAADNGAANDIKAARTQLLRLEPGDRRAALTMIEVGAQLSTRAFSASR